MRNTILGFVMGALAAHLFISTAGADVGETPHEQRVMRVLERMAVALEKTESAHRDEVQVQRDLVRRA